MKILGAILGVIGVGLFAWLLLLANTQRQAAKEGEAPQEEIKDTAPRSLTVDLLEANASGGTGTVTITEAGSGIEVFVFLEGVFTSSKKPAHIHQGTCEEPDETVFDLSDLTLTSQFDNRSTTTLEVSFDKLLELSPIYVDVHKNKVETLILACGDLIF